MQVSMTRLMSAITLCGVMPGKMPTTASTPWQISGVNCISRGTPPLMRTIETIGGVPPASLAGLWVNFIVSNAASRTAILPIALTPVSGRQMWVLIPPRFDFDQEVAAVCDGNAHAPTAVGPGPACRFANDRVVGIETALVE